MQKICRQKSYFHWIGMQNFAAGYEKKFFTRSACQKVKGSPGLK
jgi:hypothetical protein